MLGLPGSGKTHFTDQLVSGLGFERLNSDEIGQELFNKRYIYTADQIKKIHQVLNQRAQAALKTGQSLIRDVIHFEFEARQQIFQQAEQAGALSLIVWLKTPLPVVVYRNLKHKGHKRWLPTYKTMVRLKAKLERPRPTEACLSLSGLASSRKQYRDFSNYLSQLIDSKA